MPNDAEHSTSKSIDAFRMDPDKLKYRWVESFLCRSRSNEGLDDAARENSKGVGTRRGSSSKDKYVSSEASDPLHSTPWLGVGDSLGDDKRRVSQGEASRGVHCPVGIPFPYPPPPEGGTERGRGTSLSGAGSYDDSNHAGVDQIEKGRNRGHIGLKDDSVSPFLGDELSVNHQDFISPLEVVRTTGLTIGGGAYQTSRFGYARDSFCFDGARYPLGWARKSASHGDLTREAREQVAVLFRGAWSAVNPITPPQPIPSLKAVKPITAGASLVMAAELETSSRGEGLTSLTEGDASEEEGHPPLHRQEPGWTARELSIPARPARPRLVDLSGFGEGGPQRPAAVSIGRSRVGGGGRLSNCGMNARSTSSLDMLENKQDYGRRAVMLPLIDWKDWSVNRLHWTYPAVVHAFPACLFNGKVAKCVDGEIMDITSPASTSSSPFKTHSLGEVFVRTAPDKDLAPAGVGAGPWRRRWLLLQQTYLFELLQPPPSSEGVCSSHGGGSKGRKQEGAISLDCCGKRDNDGAECLEAPVGFLCLSQASVEEGGLDWGPRTLLLRCLAQPPDITREEASSRSVGRTASNAHDSLYEGVRSEEIRVELRVPSEEVGARWTELLGSRAALKMSTIFEPAAPDVEIQRHPKAEDVNTDETGRENSGDVYDADDTGKEQLEMDATFPVLGTGRFSKVVRAKRRSPWGLRADGKDANSRLYAVKVVDKQAFWSRVRNGTERADALAREVFCQTVLTWHEPSPENDDTGSEREGNDSEERPHGNVLYSREGGGGIVRLHSVLETATELVLEMDLMSRTDLFDRLEQRGTFSEPEAAGMVYNLLVAIAKCNTHGFCHRDVKLSNILYPTPAWAHGPECVVLADFGMAARASPDGLIRGRCGTSGYVAPEILRAKKHEGYSVNVDIFSAGVVLYMCLCGYEPFYGVNENELLAENKAAVVKFPLPEWRDVSQGARDLLSKMLEPDPSKRITPRNALRHPWVASHRRRTPSRPCL